MKKIVFDMAAVLLNWQPRRLLMRQLPQRALIGLRRQRPPAQDQPSISSRTIAGRARRRS